MGGCASGGGGAACDVRQSSIWATTGNGRHSQKVRPAHAAGAAQVGTGTQQSKPNGGSLVDQPPWPGGSQVGLRRATVRSPLARSPPPPTPLPPPQAQTSAPPPRRPARGRGTRRSAPPRRTGRIRPSAGCTPLATAPAFYTTVLTRERPAKKKARVREAEDGLEGNRHAVGARPSCPAQGGGLAIGGSETPHWQRVGAVNDPPGAVRLLCASGMAIANANAAHVPSRDV